MTTYLCSCWTWNWRRRRQGLSNTQHMSSLSFLPWESEFTVTVEPSLETDKGTGNISRFFSALRHASHDSVLLCLHFFFLFIFFSLLYKRHLSTSAYMFLLSPAFWREKPQTFIVRVGAPWPPDETALLNQSLMSAGPPVQLQHLGSKAIEKHQLFSFAFYHVIIRTRCVYFWLPGVSACVTVCSWDVVLKRKLFK